MSIFLSYLLTFIPTSYIGVLYLSWLQVCYMHCYPETYIPGLKITLTVTTVLVVIISFFAYCFTKPFNVIVNRLKSEGGLASDSEKKTVINTYRKLNVLTVIGCLTGFLMGNTVSLVIKIAKGALPAEPVRIVLAVIQSIIFGALVCFYVMFITNEVFAKYRRLLHIHVYETNSILGRVSSHIFIVALVGFAFVMFNMYIVPFGLVNLRLGESLSDYLSGGAKVGVVSLCLALGIMGVMVWGLEKRIRDTRNAINEIREGSLSSRIDIEMMDDFASMTTSINRLIKKLNVMMKALTEESEVVKSTADTLTKISSDASVAFGSMSDNLNKIVEESSRQNSEISNAENDVNELTESVRKVESHVIQEAGAMQQSSASINEMTANIKSVADMTNKADEVSEQLGRTCEEGNKSLITTGEMIQNLQASFNEVQEIVKAIQNIANQTNLLSMNASIEAAHAGEFGKGFSVVAGEVRALASNASKSADDIQNLIKGMQDKIKLSVDSIEETKVAFRKIQEFTGQNSELVRTISNAMGEQKVGAEENLGTTENIVSDLNDIKTLVARQDSITKSVESSMKSVVESSEIVKDAIRQSSESSDTVKNVINDINDMIIKNRDAVRKMNELLGEFDI